MKKKQVMLVTGASSGMGKDFALRLIKEGHMVYGAARRIDKMNDIEKAGGKAIQMDVIEADQVKACVEQIIEEEGRIDVLINNAGYAVYGAVETVSIEDAKRQFDVNIFGLAQITKEVLPHMRAQKNGKIINISSVGGKIFTPMGAWYHATKHALEGWSDCLRLELAPFGIDVVIIEPGVIKTEFGDVMYQPMVDRSKGTPYQDLSKKLADATLEVYSNDQASDPKVITDLVVDAVKAKKPKTRYAAGYMAKPLLTARKLLSDRMFDKIIMSQVN
jgi:short-subunit dehydrogenase